MLTILPYLHSIYVLDQYLYMHILNISHQLLLVTLTLGAVLLTGLDTTDFDPLGMPLDFFELPFKAEGGDSNSELSSS